MDCPAVRVAPSDMAYPLGELHTVPVKGSIDVPLEGEALALNLAHGRERPTGFEVHHSV